MILCIVMPLLTFCAPTTEREIHTYLDKCRDYCEVAHLPGKKIWEVSFSFDRPEVLGHK